MSFERCIWTPASTGEKIRYYKNVNATRTYLTVALTATATSCTLASTTGIVAGETIWIDGEPAYVQTVSSGTVLALVRHEPVAHAIYSPVSDDFVATYILANSGGDASMEGYFPQQRAPNQDRWDFDVVLEAAT
jgi:hypothetical protein